MQQPRHFTVEDAYAHLLKGQFEEAKAILADFLGQTDAKLVRIRAGADHPIGTFAGRLGAPAVIAAARAS